LSGRGLCDELITRPEESYRLWCVVVCDLETSRMAAPYIYDISRLRVNHTNNIWRLVQIMKISIMHFSPVFCYFLALRPPNIFRSKLFSKTFSLLSPLDVIPGSKYSEISYKLLRISSNVCTSKYVSCDANCWYRHKCIKAYPYTLRCRMLHVLVN